VYLLVGLVGMMLVMTVYSTIPELDLTVYFRPGFPEEVIRGIFLSVFQQHNLSNK
jgi:hypothetical protein